MTTPKPLPPSFSKLLALATKAIKDKRLAVVGMMLLAAPAFAQRCTSHMGISNMTTGYNLVIAPPPVGNGNIHICAVYTSVTQTATPADFQLRGCSEVTCTVSPAQNLSPLWKGHASFLDTYNVNPNEDVQLPVQRGDGVYLYLSAAPTAAQIQVFYAIY